jgi:hypothetical protein
LIHQPAAQRQEDHVVSSASTSRFSERCPRPRPAWSTLLELTENAHHEWKSAELASVFNHQMDAPLRLALGNYSVELAHELDLLGPRREEFKTLRELLNHPHPTERLLALV